MLIHVTPMLTSFLYNSIAAQSDEGCRKDLFKTSQKKGVGYLLLITAFHFFSVGLRLQSTTQDAPTCHQCHDNTLQQVHFTVSTDYLSSTKTTTKHKINQPQGRKSSVDAHGVSSCLGCSRILRHLISF